MNLSAMLILKYLEPLYGLSYGENPSNLLNLGRPVFLLDQEHWPAGRVCICDTVPAYLLSEPVSEDILVFYHSLPGDISSPVSNNLLKVPETCSLPELFNRLQEFYDRYDAWDNRLKELVQNEGSIQSLLDASFPIFQNPLLLRAADFFMLSYSSIIDEKPELAHLIDPNSSFETLTTSRLDPEYNEARNYTEPFYLPEYLSGSRELCINLFQHRNYSHRLILVEELTEITDDLAPLLAHLASYVSLALIHSDMDAAAETYSLEHLLTDIISGQQSDYSIIDNQLSEFGWSASHSYCCMTLKIASLDQQNLTSKYLCRHFEEIVAGSCAFRYEDDLVIFINLTRYDGTVDQLLNETVVFLRDSFLKTGVSNPVRGTMDLHYCYLQSKIALDIGSKYQTYRWVHRFEDISLYYLTECYTRELPTHMVCSQKLLELKAYDIRHHSEFCETLRVYLETHLNAVQASRRLFIHRSTFLYRLDRIKELINIDFEDEDMLFYLMMSFRMLNLRVSQNIELRE